MIFIKTILATSILVFGIIVNASIGGFCANLIDVMYGDKIMQTFSVLGVNTSLISINHIGITVGFLTAFVKNPVNSVFKIIITIDKLGE